MQSIANFETLVNLIYHREVAEITAFLKLMQTPVVKKGKATAYVSDKTQSLATAFGERFIMEQSVENLKNCVHAGAKKFFEATLYLHAITHV